MADFQGSGIYPLNPTHTEAALFVPSETMDREHQERPPSATPIHHPPHLCPEAYPLHGPVQAAVHPPHLHLENHPTHALPQQLRCQCPLAVPRDAVPPLAHEAEVEMAVVQVVKKAAVSFKDLVQVLVRERLTTIQK